MRPAELQIVRCTPLERLLAHIEDPSLDAKYKDQLCIAVLPFVHARPVATLTAKCSFEMSDDEINAVLAREEAYRRGDLAQVVRLPAAADDTAGAISVSARGRTRPAGLQPRRRCSATIARSA